MSALNCNNHALYLGATAALGALFRLDEMRCVIRAIEIRGGRPVIEIDPPPAAAAQFLRGAMRRRVACQHTTRTVMATSVMGAQVEWQVSALRRAGGGVLA